MCELINQDRHIRYREKEPYLSKSTTSIKLLHVVYLTVKDFLISARCWKNTIKVHQRLCITYKEVRNREPMHMSPKQNSKRLFWSSKTWHVEQKLFSEDAKVFEKIRKLWKKKQHILQYDIHIKVLMFTQYIFYFQTTKISYVSTSFDTRRIVALKSNVWELPQWKWKMN